MTLASLLFLLRTKKGRRHWTQIFKISKIWMRAADKFVVHVNWHYSSPIAQWTALDAGPLFHFRSQSNVLHYISNQPTSLSFGTAILEILVWIYYHDISKPWAGCEIAKSLWLTAETMIDHLATFWVIITCTNFQCSVVCHRHRNQGEGEVTRV